MKKRIFLRRNAGIAAAYVILIVFAIVMIFPFLWMLMSSFKDATQIFKMRLLATATIWCR